MHIHITPETEKMNIEDASKQNNALNKRTYINKLTEYFGLIAGIFINKL